MATLDVAIPCYNYGSYLERCVDSVRSQEGVAVRVLIVDDCSSDNTREIGEHLASIHDNVEYLRHRANAGHIATFNDGVDWASNLGFVLLSADDLLAPGHLRRAASVLLQDERVGVVYGDAVRFTHEPPETAPGRITTITYPGRHWLARRCADGVNVLCSPEIVLRTSVQRAVGGYDRRLAHTSDLHVLLKASAVSDVAHVGGAPGAYYRVHDTNMSSAYFESPVTDLEQRRAAFSVFFEEERLSPWRNRLLRRRVMRALASTALVKASRRLDASGVEDDVSRGLAEFARETFPSALRQPVGLGYHMRRSLGAGRLTLLPPFVAGRALRKVRSMSYVTGIPRRISR